MAAGILTGHFWAETLRSAASAAVTFGWDVAKIAAIYVLARVVGHRLIDRIAVPLIAREDAGDAQRISRIKTLQALLKSILNYVLFFVVAVMLLTAFRVDVKPVLASAGVIGLAVGIGAQKLVRDVISGFFILLENQYAVGEYVTVSGVTGVVSEIGMRMTSIRGADGKLYLISNGDVTTVCNHSRGAIETTVDVAVSHEEDMDRVIAVLNAVGEEFARETPTMASSFKVVGLPMFAAAAVTIRMQAKVAPPDAETVQMAFRRKMLERLRAEGVKLA